MTQSARDGTQHASREVEPMYKTKPQKRGKPPVWFRFPAMLRGIPVARRLAISITSCEVTRRKFVLSVTQNGGQWSTILPGRRNFPAHAHYELQQESSAQEIRHSDTKDNKYPMLAISAARAYNKMNV